MPQFIPDHADVQTGQGRKQTDLPRVLFADPLVKGAVAGADKSDDFAVFKMIDICSGDGVGCSAKRALGGQKV